MCSVIVKLCISQEKSINRLGQLVRGLRGEAQGKNKNHLLLVVATIGRELMATFEGDWWQQLHFYELFSSCICIFVTVKSEESKWVYKNTRFFKKNKKKQDLYLKKCLFSVQVLTGSGLDWVTFRGFPGNSYTITRLWPDHRYISFSSPLACVWVCMSAVCSQSEVLFFFLLLPIGHLGKGFVHSAVVQ